MQKAISWKQQVFAGIALAALVFLGYRVMESRHSDLFLKNGMKTPNFSFQRENGGMFSSSELQGKVWVVDFIFGHCAGSCPLLSQQMKLLQNKWKGNPDFKLVTFTVDPERDTAQFLKGYAEDYKADGNQWCFLTGKKDELYKVIREGFKVPALDNPEGGVGFEYIHSTRLILVDARGMVRGLYDGEQDMDLSKLYKDTKFLMSSRSKS
jgi:cytochrome oxidase Cu insertion factor (SCO1/SenC/PrrC family)